MCLCWGQGPPRKSEDELREEEELQLALALSKSEAEHKEKEVTTTSIFFVFLIPFNTCSLVTFIVLHSPASYRVFSTLVGYF
jgi:hypothetical protein